MTAVLLAVALTPGIFASPMGTTQDAASKDLTTYSDRDLGLSFRHPKTWKVEQKDKLSTTLSLPVPGSTERAELVLNVTAFNASSEIWQTIQLRANEQLGNKLVRQWEQEILGVPMLFTKVNLDSDGRPATRLTGLLYARKDRKLLARLTAPRDKYEEVEFELLSAFESLRTIDGAALAAEDPERKPSGKPVKPPKGTPPPAPRPEEQKVTRFAPNKAPTKVVKAPQTVSVKLGDGVVLIGTPAKWTVEDKGDRQFVLKLAEAGLEIQGELRVIAAEESSTAALVRSSAESLNMLDTVTERSERTPESNGAKSIVTAIFRTGKNAAGDLLTWDATASSDTLYVVLKVRVPSLADRATITKSLKALLDVISLERP